jgi:hypothetical protein
MPTLTGEFTFPTFWTTTSGTSTYTTGSFDIWHYWNYTSTTQDHSATWYSWQSASRDTTSCLDVLAECERRYYAHRSRPERRTFVARPAGRSVFRTPPETRRWHDRKAAVFRAHRLLLQCLTREQRTQLKDTSAFTVTTSAGNVYSIRRGRTANVVQLDNDQPVWRYCVHPPELVPDYDTMLAQKLLLETDEAEFVRLANRQAA